MKKVIVALAILAIALAGCGVSKSEFDALKQENEELKQELAKFKKAQQADADKDKLVLTMQLMKNISAAVGSYMIDNSVAPESLSDVGAFHIKDMPKADGWGNVWRYFRYGKDKDEYVLMSAGPDGAFSWDPEGGNYDINAMPKMFGDDIVLQSGFFIASPVSENYGIEDKTKELEKKLDEEFSEKLKAIEEKNN